MKQFEGQKGFFFSCEIWKELDRKRNSEIYGNKVTGIKWFYMRSADHKILAISGLFHTASQSVEADAQSDKW